MSISELFLPGWGVDPALYRNLSPDAELFDYGFFSADNAAMKEPAAGSASGKIILAHSMGTAFALRCAALDPSVRGLILFNPFARFAYADDFPCGWKREDVSALKNGMEKNAAVTLKHFYRNCAFPEKMRIGVPAQLNITALLEGLDFLAAFDYRNLLHSIQCPVAVLTGSGDRIVNREMSSLSLKGKVCAGEYDGGHFLPFGGKVDLDSVRKALEVL